MVDDVCSEAALTPEESACVTQNDKVQDMSKTNENIPQAALGDARGVVWACGWQPTLLPNGQCAFIPEVQEAATAAVAEEEAKAKPEAKKQNVENAKQRIQHEIDLNIMKDGGSLHSKMFGADCDTILNYIEERANKQMKVPTEQNARRAAQANICSQKRRVAMTRNKATKRYIQGKRVQLL